MMKSFDCRVLVYFDTIPGLSQIATNVLHFVLAHYHTLIQLIVYAIIFVSYSVLTHIYFNHRVVLVIGRNNIRRYIRGFRLITVCVWSFNRDRSSV